MKATVLCECLILTVGLAALVGCGQQASTPPAKPAAEIKGAPINSPVAAAPATPANVATPAAPVPAALPAPPSSFAETATPAALATPAAPAAPSPLDTPAEKVGDYYTVGFDRLAGFTYEMPDESALATNKFVEGSVKVDQIPHPVREFDKKQVSLKGFMLPLKVEGGLITELLIMRDQSMCCYGSVPKINEWVSVKMTGKGVKPIMDQAVTLYGTLHVGEIRENGYLVGIYSLDGEKMAGPLDL